MDNGFAVLYGQLDKWPSKDEMAALLRAAGLKIYVGHYSIRLEDCSHFSFEEYGGDLGEPQIEADADSVVEMSRDAAMVSQVLRRAGIRHRFEIYDSADKLVAYFHHEWPSES